MIDPKFNEIPETPKTGSRSLTETVPAEGEASAQTGATPRQGLSINDTIAADASLSVGGRGADTSGVRAGAGAGSGSSFVTAGNPGESPAPRVAPGPTGSGTTPLSDAATEQTVAPQDADLLDNPGEYSTASGSNQSNSLSSDDIALYAYQIWVERGSPHGSHEEDWRRAEQELRERARNTKASAANA